MRVLIQRVKEASVTIESKLVNSIADGYLLYVGFTKTDTKEIIDLMVQKIIKLRIYEDPSGKINDSIPKEHQILSISQFTLYANTKGQNRPSFIEAMSPLEADHLYQYFNQTLSKYVQVKQGVFGSNMDIYSVNKGPMTILLEI